MTGRIFPPTIVQKEQLLSSANEDPRLSAGARRVLKALLDHHNPKVGRVFPSQDRLAKKLAYTSRWVRECLKLLERCGYILRKRGAAPNGGTLYFFPLSVLSRGAGHKRGAELQCSEERKRSSAKHSQEHISKAVRRKMPAKPAPGISSIGQWPPEVRRGNAEKQKVADELAVALGGRDLGWQMLSEFGETATDGIVKEIIAKRTSLSDAVVRIARDLADRKAS